MKKSSPKIIHLSLNFLSLLFLLSMLTSCGPDTTDKVDQDKIYMEYELFYDSNTDITYARASFRFSNEQGTLMELKRPSEVAFNGEQLSLTGMYYYEKKLNGFKDGGTFVWKDYNGKSFSNSIGLNKDINFPPELTFLQRSITYELIWRGDSLKPKESVTLQITGSKKDEPQSFIQDTSGHTSIFLPTHQLKQLSSGSAEMIMDWRHTYDLQQKTSAGGTITCRYRPVNKIIVLF